MSVTVISLGGSIVAPDKPDTEFLKAFREAVIGFLGRRPEDRLILVTGGGAPARIYQNALKAVTEENDPSVLDWIGIRATHLNGMLVKSVLGPYAPDSLVLDPTGDIEFTGRVLVAGGWKPGFSTDTDAVILAKRFGASTVINLSNTKMIYTDDPRKNPDAKPIRSISWEDFRKMVGDEWVPGKNVPFDPVASKLAAEASIKVIASDGRDIPNTLSILEGKEFTGTLIGA